LAYQFSRERVISATIVADATNQRAAKHDVSLHADAITPDIMKNFLHRLVNIDHLGPDPQESL
jgi:hypothetical protein